MVLVSPRDNKMEAAVLSASHPQDASTLVTESSSSESVSLSSYQKSKKENLLLLDLETGVDPAETTNKEGAACDWDYIKGEIL